MLLRYRMNRIIRLLENNDSDGINAAIDSGKYQKAIKALEDQGCIKTVKDWSGSIRNIWLADHYATYQLSRQDIWLNRFYGFLAGVATSVVAHCIIALIG